MVLKQHPETMAGKFEKSLTPLFNTSTKIMQYQHCLLEKVEYRAIVCQLGNRAPTGLDMTENRNWNQGI